MRSITLHPAPLTSPVPDEGMQYMREEATLINT